MQKDVRITEGPILGPSVCEQKYIDDGHRS